MATTAGSPLSWATLALLAGAVVGVKSGCTPIPQDDGKAWLDSVVVGDVLADVGPFVVLPALARFQARLDTLDTALEAWDAAHTSGAETAGARADAQAAWLDATLVWQELEVMQIGPAGSSLTVTGGEDLRDEIYSWPTVNPCRVDQEVVGGGWSEPAWFGENLVNSYGLDAVEHLVHAGEDNACPGQVDINADGTWDALGPEGVESERIAFAQVLSTHLSDQAGTLVERWSPEGDDFTGALALTRADSPFADEQEALNSVFDALFYLELHTKDRKLAQPMGTLNCSTETCPDDAEHLPSGASMAAVAANLEGFRALFVGGDGAGFDDLLVELGHGDLATEILEKTDAAITVASSTSVSIQAGVDTDPAAVQAVFDAVKAVCDLLKGDLVTVLALEIPAEAAGDAD